MQPRLVSSREHCQEWRVRDRGGSSEQSLSNEPSGSCASFTGKPYTVTNPTLSMAVFPLTQTELQILRVLFVIPVLVGIVGRALAGGSALEAVVGGGVLGGLYFLPLALIYFVYLFGKRRSVNHP